MPIRQLLIECCQFQYLEYLGNVFDKVQCPCIIFQASLTGKPFNGIGIQINDGKRIFSIQNMRPCHSEYFNFSATDAEYDIINKMESLDNAVTLKGKSKFALGIVTGNNKKYISHKKAPDNELILKGCDLFKFRFVPSDNFIKYEPKLYQQVAPTQIYRAEEKLFYRFICNQLVFAYDNQKTLSLNSCNILIPEIDGLYMKYVMAVLNSRPAQFYFKKNFKSVKVLRSHIEQIPIPYADQAEQTAISSLADSIRKTADYADIMHFYEILDRKISSLYKLSEKDIAIIRESLKDDNLFLV